MITPHVIDIIPIHVGNSSANNSGGRLSGQSHHLTLYSGRRTKGKFLSVSAFERMKELQKRVDDRQEEGVNSL